MTPSFGPISRTNLLKALRDLGFEGPFSGGKHQFVVRGNLALRIPNPHQREISKGLLVRILQQAKITKEEWVSAK